MPESTTPPPPRPARPGPPHRRAGRRRVRGPPRAADATRTRSTSTSAEVDAEVEDAAASRGRRARSRAGRAPRPPEARTARPPSEHARPAPAIGCRTSRRCRRCSPRPARSRRCASGSGPPADVGRVGRHAGLVAVPHGAKSYLAAALALGDDRGEPLVWIARDAEIGDRVAEELGAWLGDPAAVASLEPRTALAYERSELVADETAARVAALAAWRQRPGADPRRQRPGAPPAHHRARRPARRRRASCGPAPASTRTRCCASCSTSATCPVLEVAGRGEFARRGGIVDVFPPSLRAADPDRVLRRRDRLAAGVRPDRPAGHRQGRAGGPPARVGVPAADRRRGRRSRARLGRGAAKLGERLAADLARFAGAADDPLRPGRRGRRRDPGAWRSGTPPRSGPPSWPRRPGSTTSTPGTLLVLDEPGDIAEAAAFLWRQADERAGRADRGRRPAQGLALDLPAAARLEGPPRRRRARSS